MVRNTKQTDATPSRNYTAIKKRTAKILKQLQLRINMANPTDVSCRGFRYRTAVTYEQRVRGLARYPPGMRFPAMPVPMESLIGNECDKRDTMSRVIFKGSPLNTEVPIPMTVRPRERCLVLASYCSGSMRKTAFIAIHKLRKEISRLMSKVYGIRKIMELGVRGSGQRKTPRPRGDAKAEPVSNRKIPLTASDKEKLVTKHWVLTTMIEYVNQVTLRLLIEILPAFDFAGVSVAVINGNAEYKVVNPHQFLDENENAGRQSFDALCASIGLQFSEDGVQIRGAEDDDFDSEEEEDESSSSSSDSSNASSTSQSSSSETEDSSTSESSDSSPRKRRKKKHVKRRKRKSSTESTSEDDSSDDEQVSRKRKKSKYIRRKHRKRSSSEPSTNSSDSEVGRVKRKKNENTSPSKNAENKYKSWSDFTRSSSSQGSDSEGNPPTSKGSTSDDVSCDDASRELDAQLDRELNKSKKKAPSEATDEPSVAVPALHRSNAGKLEEAFSIKKHSSEESTERCGHMGLLQPGSGKESTNNGPLSQMDKLLPQLIRRFQGERQELPAPEDLPQPPLDPSQEFRRLTERSELTASTNIMNARLSAVEEIEKALGVELPVDESDTVEKKDGTNTDTEATRIASEAKQDAQGTVQQVDNVPNHSSVIARGFGEADSICGGSGPSDEPPVTMHQPGDNGDEEPLDLSMSTQRKTKELHADQAVKGREIPLFQYGPWGSGQALEQSPLTKDIKKEKFDRSDEGQRRYVVTVVDQQTKRRNPVDVVTIEDENDGDETSPTESNGVTITIVSEEHSPVSNTSEAHDNEREQEAIAPEGEVNASTQHIADSSLDAVEHDEALENNAPGKSSADITTAMSSITAQQATEETNTQDAPDSANDAAAMSSKTTQQATVETKAPDAPASANDAADTSDKTENGLTQTAVEGEEVEGHADVDSSQDVTPEMSNVATQLAGVGTTLQAVLHSDVDDDKRSGNTDIDATKTNTKGERCQTVDLTTPLNNTHEEQPADGQTTNIALPTTVDKDATNTAKGVAGVVPEGIEVGTEATSVTPPSKPSDVNERNEKETEGGNMEESGDASTFATEELDANPTGQNGLTSQSEPVDRIVKDCNETGAEDSQSGSGDEEQATASNYSAPLEQPQETTIGTEADNVTRPVKTTETESTNVVMKRTMSATEPDSSNYYTVRLHDQRITANIDSAGGNVMPLHEQECVQGRDTIVCHLAFTAVNRPEPGSAIIIGEYVYDVVDTEPEGTAIEIAAVPIGEVIDHQYQLYNNEKRKVIHAYRSSTSFNAETSLYDVLSQAEAELHLGVTVSVNGDKKAQTKQSGVQSDELTEQEIADALILSGLDETLVDGVADDEVTTLYQMLRQTMKSPVRVDEDWTYPMLPDSIVGFTPDGNSNAASMRQSQPDVIDLENEQEQPSSGQQSHDEPVILQETITLDGPPPRPSEQSRHSAARWLDRAPSVFRILGGVPRQADGIENWEANPSVLVHFADMLNMPMQEDIPTMDEIVRFLASGEGCSSFVDAQKIMMELQKILLTKYDLSRQKARIAMICLTYNMQELKQHRDILEEQKKRDESRIDHLTKEYNKVVAESEKKLQTVRMKLELALNRGPAEGKKEQDVIEQLQKDKLEMMLKIEQLQKENEINARNLTQLGTTATTEEQENPLEDDLPTNDAKEASPSSISAEQERSKSNGEAITVQKEKEKSAEQSITKPADEKVPTPRKSPGQSTSRKNKSHDISETPKSAGEGRVRPKRAAKRVAAKVAIKRIRSASSEDQLEQAAERRDQRSQNRSTPARKKHSKPSSTLSSSKTKHGTEQSPKSPTPKRKKMNTAKMQKLETHSRKKKRERERQERERAKAREKRKRRHKRHHKEKKNKKRKHKSRSRSHDKQLSDEKGGNRDRSRTENDEPLQQPGLLQEEPPAKRSKTDPKDDALFKKPVDPKKYRSDKVEEHPEAAEKNREEKTGQHLPADKKSDAAESESVVTKPSESVVTKPSESVVTKPSESVVTKQSGGGNQDQAGGTERVIAPKSILKAPVNDEWASRADLTGKWDETVWSPEWQKRKNASKETLASKVIPENGAGSPRVPAPSSRDPRIRVNDRGNASHPLVQRREAEEASNNTRMNRSVPVRRAQDNASSTLAPRAMMARANHQMVRSTAHRHLQPGMHGYAGFQDQSYQHYIGPYQNQGSAAVPGLYPGAAQRPFVYGPQMIPVPVMPQGSSVMYAEPAPDQNWYHVPPQPPPYPEAENGAANDPANVPPSHSSGENE